MILPALIAKFLSAGAIAQAATGAAVVVVAVTGVGAAGALPGPVQDTFATVVAEITPLEPPMSEESTEEVVSGEETVGEETDEATESSVVVDEVVDEAAAAEAYVTAWALDGPEKFESFTAWVEAGNQDPRVKDWLRANGMNFGNVVSAHASGKGFSDAELEILGAKVDDSTDAVTEPEPVVDPDDAETVTEETEAGTTVEDRGSRGHGKGTGGNGNGGGNGKN